MPGQIASVGKLARETRAEELLRTFDIIQYRDRYSTQLSGGEKQRVALCVALANDPDILLCDEPTGNLDRDNSTHIYEYLRKINQDHNKTIILVTHDQGIKPYVDKVYYLDRDQIVEADNYEN